MEVDARKQCMRWLAFGLFYLRSKQFFDAPTIKKVDLTCLVVYEEEIEAFQRALQNPAEIAYQGHTGARTSVVKLCTVGKAPWCTPMRRRHRP